MSRSSAVASGYQQQILFEDIFEVRALNENGKKFERVNRLHCRASTFDVDLVLDVNSELFDAIAGDRVSVVFANSLTEGADDGTYKPNYGNSPLLKNYDYVMHGRVYSIKHVENHMVELQASFGGLLCRLRGEQAQVEAFVMDMNVFLLMRKGAGIAL